MTALALALCLVTSFLFSGTEAGSLSLNRVRLRHRLGKQNATAPPAACSGWSLPPGADARHGAPRDELHEYLRHPAHHAGVRHRVGKLAGYTWPRWRSACPCASFGLELLPKSLFRRFPYRSLAALSEVLRLADWILSPLLAMGTLLLRLAPRKPEERKLFAAREDYKYLTIESERQGTLAGVEREMIHNVMDLGGAKARDVMVPLDRVKSLPTTASVPQLLDLARETNLTRFPLADRRGNFVALVNVFEVVLEGERKRHLTAYQRRIVTVTPEEEAYSIMKKLRAARASLAAVNQDKTVGLVVFEDLAGLLVRVGQEKKVGGK